MNLPDVNRYLADIERNFEKTESRVMVNLFNTGIVVDVKPLVLAAIRSIKRQKKIFDKRKNR